MKLVIQIAFGVALGLILIPVSCVVCSTATVGTVAVVAIPKVKEAAEKAKAKMEEERKEKEEEEKKEKEEEAKKVQEPKKIEAPKAKEEPKKEEEKAIGYVVDEIGYGIFPPKLNGRIIELRFLVKNTSQKVVKLARPNPPRMGFKISDGDSYAFALFSIYENGERNGIINFRSSYLIQEREKILYPGEKYLFAATLEGCNLPVKDLEISTIFTKHVFEGVHTFRIFQDDWGLKVAPKGQEQKPADPPAPMPKPESIPQPAPKPEPMPAIKPIPDGKELPDKPKPKVDTFALDKLEKEYRDAGRKSLDAEKKDQFEDARKWKKISLEKYAEWKKLKEQIGQ